MNPFDTFGEVKDDGSPSAINGLREVYEQEKASLNSALHSAKTPSEREAIKARIAECDSEIVRLDQKFVAWIETQKWGKR